MNVHWERTFIYLMRHIIPTVSFDCIDYDHFIGLSSCYMYIGLAHKVTAITSVTFHFIILISVSAASRKVSPDVSTCSGTVNTEQK